jgi:hypothetical protein
LFYDLGGTDVWCILKHDIYMSEISKLPWTIIISLKDKGQESKIDPVQGWVPVGVG